MRALHSELVDQARILVTMLTCPYYQKTGQCVSGCRDEPACETGGPWEGEVLEVLRSIADGTCYDTSSGIQVHIDPPKPEVRYIPVPLYPR